MPLGAVETPTRRTNLIPLHRKLKVDARGRALPLPEYDQSFDSEGHKIVQLWCGDFARLFQDTSTPTQHTSLTP